MKEDVKERLRELFEQALAQEDLEYSYHETVDTFEVRERDTIVKRAGTEVRCTMSASWSRRIS
jgi:hypothetical protein